MAAHLTSSQSRKNLDIQNKLKVIEDFKLGKSIPDICAEFGVSKSQVYRIIKGKETITKNISKGNIPVHSKLSLNKAKYPAIDNGVYEWMCSLRSLCGTRRPLPVTGPLIKARARYEAKQQGIDDFKASDGWLWHWRSRYNISKSIRLHGEAGDVDVQTAQIEMDTFRSSLGSMGYKLENIFNMDETGLFFRTIPNRSYLLGSEKGKQQAARGSKAMKAKDRITVMLCVNTTGTCKIPPTVIGSAKNPRCFKDNPSSVPYFNQKNAWCDREIYNKWWADVFLMAIRKWTTDQVALIIDGFSGHHLNCVDSQVRVFTLPPNITSIFQPLDQGIIAAFKAGYKTRLLDKVISTANSFAALQAMAKSLPNGSAGLAYGSAAHVRDAIELVKLEWDSLSPSVIAACWEHAHCLPVVDTAEVSSSGRDYINRVKHNSIDMMCSKLSTLSLSNPNVVGMLNFNCMEELVTSAQNKQDTASAMLSKWLQLEEDAVVTAVEEEDEESEHSVEMQETTDKLELLNQTLSHLQKMHDIGAQLKDSHMMTVARDLCIHVQQYYSANDTDIKQ